MLPQNPESGNIAPQEKISDNLRVEVIDQDHQNYPYKISDKPPYLQLMDDLFSLGQPVSQEGFSIMSLPTEMRVGILQIF